MQNMTVYVAAKFEDRTLASHMMDKLRLLGFTVEYDWTQGEEAGDHELTEDQRFHIGMAEIRAAANCAYFWLLAPEHGGRGCFVEMGAALQSTREPWIVVSGAHDRFIFGALADSRFDQHDAALAFFAEEMTNAKRREDAQLCLQIS